MTQEPFTDPYRAPVAAGETESQAYPADDLTVGYGSDSGSSSGVGVDAGSGSTSDVAKDQAAQVGQGAADAGKHVTGVAKEQAGNVAGEAKAQARNLADQARSEVQGQAHTQKQRAADGLRSIGHELGSMADGSEQEGPATQLARQASQLAHDASSWLEQRDPGDLLEEIRSFARRRPGAFLGVAVGAGVLAGRLTRGIKDAGASDSSGSSGSPAASRSTSGNGSGTTGYSAPAYGTTAAGATYITETEPLTDDSGSPSEFGTRTSTASTSAFAEDYPVDDTTLSGEAR